MINTGSILRVFVCWLILSVATLAYEKEVSLWMLPFIKAAGEWVQPAFSWTLGIEEFKDSVVIALRATAIEPVPAGPSSGLNEGTIIRAGSTLVHVILPSIIWICVLVVWPCATLLERIAILAAGFVASQVTAVFLATLLLAAKIEMMLQSVALQANERRPETLLIDIMIFIETGGNIVIALVGAAMCGFAVTNYLSAFHASRVETLPVNRSESGDLAG